MEYTQEDINLIIESIQPSVDVIDQVIEDDKRYKYYTEEEKADAVDRNYRHIEIILGKEQVATKIQDSKPYKDAVKRAKKYLGI